MYSAVISLSSLLQSLSGGKLQGLVSCSGPASDCVAAVFGDRQVDSELESEDPHGVTRSWSDEST
jgi:hypothetical protein